MSAAREPGARDRVDPRWLRLGGLVLLVAACEEPLSLGTLLRVEPAPDAGELCGRTEPAQDVGDGPACTGEAAPRAFRYALCSCSEIQSSAPIVIDAFDSALGAYEDAEPGGSIGANGAFYPAEASLTGTLQVAGASGIALTGDLEVGGDLLDQGQLDGQQFAVRVGGAARVLGNLHVASLSAAGGLAVSASSDVAIAAGEPPFTRDASAVDAPCACDGPTLLDVRALVDAAQAQNDNAAIGLDPAAGLKALDGPLERTLPCGRYYVDELYAAHPLTLTIAGPVELYVRSGIIADGAGTLDFQLAPGGQLDLFMGQGLSTMNRVEIGSEAAPTRTRLYAAGPDSTLYFGGETTLGASVYAPGSGLVTEGRFETFGALFVGRASAAEAFTIHYDRALRRDACP